MKIIGIDNGLRGAIARIDIERNFVKVVSTPIYQMQKMKKRKGKTIAVNQSMYDIPKMVELIRLITPDFACIEKAQAFPGQGGVSNYTTGYGHGLWIGILAMAHIPYELVHPKTWQKEFFKGMSGDTKKLSYQVASSLFPKIQLATPRGRILDGCSDALLLMEYVRRRKSGKI